MNINNRECQIKTVTVVGANGTMGKNISAIFASFGNAQVYLISRSIEKSRAAKKSAYLAVRAESINNNLIVADYNQLAECISKSDLVFESSSENWDIKKNVTQIIVEAAKQNFQKNIHTIFCTGTSGQSITALAELFPDELRKNYFGFHMFNPPYIMTLVEMIPTKYTDRTLFESVMSYAKRVLYRTVVEVTDSPAFLGNRIGFQFINEALQKAVQYKDNGGVDYIDAILGPFTGRAMPPLQTSDFVGLDVHKAIVDNIFDNTTDFAHDDFVFASFAQKLVDTNNLGKKTGSGLYKTYIHDSGTKIRQVYDINLGTYRNTITYTFPFAETMINYLHEGDYTEAFNVLKTNRSSESDLACYFLLKYIIYSLKISEFIGHNIHSADDVMATGFNWCPPLAMIDAFGGVNEIKKLAIERIDSDFLNLIDFDHLLYLIEPSKYDFRKFFRAKR